MSLRLSGTTSGYVELDAPAVAGNNTIKLPTSNGSANQFLKNGSTPGTLGYSSLTEDGSFVMTQGGYPAAMCRAWVNFNGTGTVAIRASFNVSSITDNGTGDYTVNFTNAMADANYSCVGATGGQNNTSTGAAYLADQSTPRTTSLIRIATLNITATLVDTPQINVAIFR